MKVIAWSFRMLSLGVVFSRDPDGDEWDCRRHLAAGSTLACRALLLQVRGSPCTVFVSSLEQPSHLLETRSSPRGPVRLHVHKLGCALAPRETVRLRLSPVSSGSADSGKSASSTARLSPELCGFRLAAHSGFRRCWCGLDGTLVRNDNYLD